MTTSLETVTMAVTLWRKEEHKETEGRHKENNAGTRSREQKTRFIQVAPIKQWFIKLTNCSINSIFSVRRQGWRRFRWRSLSLLTWVIQSLSQTAGQTLSVNSMTWCFSVVISFPFIMLQTTQSHLASVWTHSLFSPGWKHGYGELLFILFRMCIISNF